MSIKPAAGSVTIAAEDMNKILGLLETHGIYFENTVVGQHANLSTGTITLNTGSYCSFNDDGSVNEVVVPSKTIISFNWTRKV